MLNKKSEMTKLSILIEIMHENKKIKDIAKVVNITIQGVSEYIKILRKEGLIDKDMRITPKGTAFVIDKIEELRSYVSNIIGQVKIIKTTEAVAGEDIKKDDRVGLFIENGYLVAKRKKSPSQGISINDAFKGEDVGVRDLDGIIDLKLGTIKVCRLPSISDGGSRAVDINKVKSLISENEKIGVFGAVAYVTLKKLNINIDFEFGAVKASQEAAHRGISSIIFVSSDLFKYVIEDLERTYPGISFVPYKIIDFSNVHS
ncbi:MAG: DNA-binding protein [Thermoplasmata archaeon]|nr:winged helix-turn-helix transcriptional regulator [Thermoplasmata archaeon]